MKHTKLFLHIRINNYIWIQNQLLIWQLYLNIDQVVWWMATCLGVPVCRQVCVPLKWPLEPDQTRHRPDPHARRTPCQDFQGLLCAHTSRLHLRPLLGLPGSPHLSPKFQGHGSGRVRLPLTKQISIYILQNCNKTLIVRFHQTRLLF